MVMETPDIRNTSYSVAASSATSMMPGDVGLANGGMGVVSAGPAMEALMRVGAPFKKVSPWARADETYLDKINKLTGFEADVVLNAQMEYTDDKEDEKENIVANELTRLVKVFIVDPDPKVPVGKRLLYRTEEILTDLTNQELFFDIDIKDILEKHNAYRITVEDKKANKDKPVMLEPIRVRELRMQVIDLATF